MAENKQKEAVKNPVSGKKWIILLIILAALLAAGIVMSVLAAGEKETPRGDKSGTSTGAVTGTAAEGEELTWEDGERIDYVKAGVLTLGKYKGIEVEITPTADEINEEMRKQAKKVNVKGEEKVKKGDYVFLKYTGSIDGVENEELAESDVTLRVGDYKYAEGFENGLIGKEVGQTCIIPVVFPKDYEDTAVAGSQVDFSITIQGKFNDAYAKKASKNRYSTVKQYRKYLKQKLKKENGKEAGEMAFEELMENCEVKQYPKEILRQTLEEIKDQYRTVAELEGTSYEEFLASFGMDENGLQELAEDTIKERMAAKTIALREGLQLTDKLYRKYLMRVEESEDKNISMEKLLEEYEGYYGHWPKDDMYVEMAKDFVGEKAIKK
ncbi:MAG: FKBP-type peptidyl-prolyl cis-trans isomerase [Lachnospiraceae bacterium]|nr:FKBP-type peptidyl-prolyl cis-trans isomerase [Lachnospiraceae bacterium]